LGKIVVELVAQACIEIGKGLDEARDVRVLDRLRRKAQPAGDLRVRIGELGGEAPDVGELAIVVGQQLVRHWASWSWQSCGSPDRDSCRARLLPGPAGHT